MRRPRATSLGLLLLTASTQTGCTSLDQVVVGVGAIDLLAAPLTFLFGLISAFSALAAE